MALTETKRKSKIPLVTDPLLRGKERLSVWQKARGMWKNRKPDPIKELKKIRKEWERTIKKFAAVYTLDTNAIVYYIKGDISVVSILETAIGEAYPLYVSVITEAELFSYSRLDETEVNQIDNLLRTVSIISLDSRLARLSGVIRRMYGVKLYDSVIAATALSTGSTPLTRNVKDFKKIAGLSFQRV